MANNFLPFCPTDTGTNLLTQNEYDIAADRAAGNQPGVASSKLVNKAIRQSAAVTSQFAQYVSTYANVNTLDDGVSAALLAQITAALMPISPIVQRMISAGASGTWNRTHAFFIASGSATAGATYTNNSVTFTVAQTVASGTLVYMRGGAAPLASGTLTKTGGTGDATLTFYAVRFPKSMDVQAIGGGGGGAGSGTANGSGVGNGGDTTFGSSLITCGGGQATNALGGGPAAGGTVTVNSPAITIIASNGGTGNGGAANTTAGNMASTGGQGASTPFGAGGSGGPAGGGGVSADTTVFGSGGGGGGTNNNANSTSGNGGSAGAYAYVMLINPSATYAFTVGAGGVSGSAGANGRGGSTGAGGAIITIENFQ